MLTVEKATPEDLAAYIGIYGWIGWAKGEIVCVAGFMRRGDRLWAYLDVFDRLPTVSLMREMKSRISDTKEDVYALCDSTFENAPKLLRILGFNPTEETFSGQRIWKWQIP